MIVTLNREKLRAKRREKALTQKELAEVRSNHRFP